MIIGICTFFAGISYGWFFAIIVPNPAMTMSLVPLVMLPLMLMGGFYVNQGNIPYFFYEIKYLSMFKYGYQAAIEVDFIININFCNKF